MTKTIPTPTRADHRRRQAALAEQLRDWREDVAARLDKARVERRKAREAAQAAQEPAPEPRWIAHHTGTPRETRRRWQLDQHSQSRANHRRRLPRKKPPIPAAQNQPHRNPERPKAGAR